MHNTINLRTQHITYFIPSVDVFCYCHFLKDVKFVLTVKSLCYVTVFNIVFLYNNSCRALSTGAVVCV